MRHPTLCVRSWKTTPVTPTHVVVIWTSKQAFGFFVNIEGTNANCVIDILFNRVIGRLDVSRGQHLSIGLDRVITYS